MHLIGKIADHAYQFRVHMEELIPSFPSSWSPGWFALAAESMPEVMITKRYLALRAPFESLVGMEGDRPQPAAMTPARCDPVHTGKTACTSFSCPGVTTTS